MADGEEYLEYEASFQVVRDPYEVEVSRVYTPKGTRLELVSSDPHQVIRLDAMALESVSWQDPVDFPLDPERGETVPQRSPRISEVDEATVEAVDRIQITNEFAQVEVRKIVAPDREAVSIESPKLGHEIALDVEDLISLTAQSKDRFSEFLRRPFGPDH